MRHDSMGPIDKLNVRLKFCIKMNYFQAIHFGSIIIMMILMIRTQCEKDNGSRSPLTVVIESECNIKRQNGCKVFDTCVFLSV